MSELAQHIEIVAKALLGEPNAKLSNKRELRWGSHGSMSVDLEKGTWFCHETETGGGVSSLIKRDNPLANVPEFLESIGIEVERPNGQANGHDTIRTSLVATYPYVDEHGEVTYEVCRYEPKTFRQRRIVNGKTVWGLGDAEPLPYHLPDIINNPDKPIFICEGEKDADNLAALGFVTTCNSGGAGKWADSLNKWFEGRDVIILPHNDKAGDAHVRTLLGQLQGKAKRIKVVKLSDKDKGDVTDWLDAGGDRQALGQLIRAAEEIRERVTPLPTLSLSDIAQLPPVEWLVEGLVPDKSLAMMYGEPGCGKTFIALDMALSIAHKTAWQDQPVLGGQVVYVAGEGVGGLKKRIAAWHKHNGKDQAAPFIVIPTAVDLMDEINTQDLHTTIQATAQGPVSLVIFDTLARSMQGDENSSQDMGRTIKAMDEVRDAFGCCVMFIHHSGKDSSRGHRGSSATLGAVDLSMRVERMGEAVSLTVEKQKDAEMMDPIWMNTSSVELSTDALALESDTSLVLTRTDQPTGGNTKGLRPAQRAVLDALTEALIQHGKPSPGGENYPAGVQVVDEAQWRNIALAKSISTGNPDAERKAFSRAAEALIQRNIAAKWQNLVWRVKT
tara:strand:- start:1298 stop:3139 length:1842 start_codon:yes stop_codon:yes gene_type:complete